MFGPPLCWSLTVQQIQPPSCTTYVDAELLMVIYPAACAYLVWLKYEEQQT